MKNTENKQKKRERDKRKHETILGVFQPDKGLSYQN